MNNIIKFFNYNWFKIIKENKQNNKKNKIIKKEKLEISKLLLKKEICGIVFVISNLLIIYISSKEIYEMRYEKNIFIHILKDNFMNIFIWFIIFSILPILTSIIINKQIKRKKYLLIILLYTISNLLNILLISYFITSFINTILPGIIGIINIIITIIININIIVKIKENYLK